MRYDAAVKENRTGSVFSSAVDGTVREEKRGDTEERIRHENYTNRFVFNSRFIRLKKTVVINVNKIGFIIFLHQQFPLSQSRTYSVAHHWAVNQTHVDRFFNVFCQSSEAVSVKHGGSTSIVIGNELASEPQTGIDRDEPGQAGPAVDQPSLLSSNLSLGWKNLSVCV